MIDSPTLLDENLRVQFNDLHEKRHNFDRNWLMAEE